MIKHVDAYQSTLCISMKKPYFQLLARVQEFSITSIQTMISLQIKLLFDNTNNKQIDSNFNLYKTLNEKPKQ